MSNAKFKPVDCGMSDRYVTINTERLIREFESRGFVKRETFTRSSAGSRHVVRMRSKDSRTVNGETLFPEIELHNSYNGKCSFSVKMGIFRQVCTNGLTIRAKEFGELFYKTRHIGNEATLAEEITIQFAENLPKLWEIQERLAAYMLTDDQKIELAMKAAELRWKQTFTPEQAAALLKAERPEDDSNSAWHVFNVLQEHVIRGGVKLDGMKRTPREVRDARNNPALNDALFNLVYDTVTQN